MYQQAPGEAEAELARLNKARIIDAVVTDDGDGLIFGATHVIRKYVPLVTMPTFDSTIIPLSPDLTGDKDAVTVYTAQAIRDTPGIALTEGGLLLVALLSGGDYQYFFDPSARYHTVLSKVVFCIRNRHTVGAFP